MRNLEEARAPGSVLVPRRPLLTGVRRQNVRGRSTGPAGSRARERSSQPVECVGRPWRLRPPLPRWHQWPSGRRRGRTLLQCLLVQVAASHSLCVVCWEDGPLPVASVAVCGDVLCWFPAQIRWGPPTWWFRCPFTSVL